MLVPGSRFGAYEILSPLGAGAMGEVFRARDIRLQRDVAIKVLPESFTRDADRVGRFEREARLLAALNCRNIAAIYGLEEADGARALVLELVEGETLAERLARRAPSLVEAIAIASQIAEGLDAAHEKGIVHRDLKPANIKITPDSTVKVLDFGLAKGADEAPAITATTLPTAYGGTHAGVILGTAPYMSPEQARGLAVDKRTDIWAFGCVLYEMLTGRTPFGGATMSDVIAAILGSEPNWSALPPATPPAVTRLLRRLLEKDLKRRVRDIGDARAELEQAVAAPAAHEGPAAPDQPRALRVWRRVAAIAVATLLVVMTAVAWSLRARNASESIPISPHVTVSQVTSYDGTEADGAISPDGRSFVFISNHGGTADLWVRQIAGGDPVRLTNDAVEEGAPIYAPNGESIFFAKAGAIWTIGVLGGQPRKVVDRAQAPAPSPDGRSLAWFASSADGTSLVVGGVDGSDARALAANVAAQPSDRGRGVSRPTWSRDGKRIAYSSGGLFAPRNLFVVDAAGSAPRQITHFTGASEGAQTQAWLPDNRHLLVSYVAWPHSAAATDLGVVDVDTGETIRLTLNVGQGFQAPSVSADGTRVMLTANQIQNEIWKVPFGPDPEANGRAAVLLVGSSYYPQYSYVTRDGKTVMFSSPVVGSRNLLTMPLDGSAAPRQITALPGDTVTHFTLSPDRTRVAFVAFATGTSDVWVQNVDGSGLKNLTHDAAAERWPIWSPDGRWIAHSSTREGREGTWRVPAEGGPSEKLWAGGSRGDWIRKPDGTGTYFIASGPGLRLIDVEARRVIWEDQRGGANGLPMFSSDGRFASLPRQDSSDRDAIWVSDVATGASRIAVRFPQPFQLSFRANWMDGDRVFVVTRSQVVSHIVVLDKFWMSEGRGGSQ